MSLETMIPERISVNKAPRDARYQRAVRIQRGYAGAAIISFGDICFALLGVLGWLACTWLIAAGCCVAVFWMAGNGSLYGFFEQVSLLGSHYLGAPVSARKAFGGQLFLAFGVLFLIAGFFRRGSLISIFKPGGTDGQ